MGNAHKTLRIAHFNLPRRKLWGGVVNQPEEQPDQRGNSPAVLSTPEAQQQQQVIDTGPGEQEEEPVPELSEQDPRENISTAGHHFEEEEMSLPELERPILTQEEIDAFVIMVLQRIVDRRSGGGEEEEESERQSVSEPPGQDFPHDTTTEGYVRVGGSVTGNISPAGDYDYFEVDLIAGRSYVIEMKGSTTGNGTLGDPFLYLYDGMSNFITNDDDGGTGLNSRIEINITETGTYYIEAGEVDDADTGTYTITVTEAEPQSVSEPSGGDFPAGPNTAGYIVVGESVTGNISTNDDNDWFRVELEAGNSYVIDMKGSATTGTGTLPDPYLVLYDSMSTEVANNDDGGTGTNARIEINITTTGTYYINASETLGNTGTYTITVTEDG